MKVDFLEAFQLHVAGRYTLQRELGHGGFATVYLAYDHNQGRLVALKVLTPDLALSVRAERFMREIHIAAQLVHPHVLPVHDSGAADRFFYYVMPYVEGQSLRARLDREGPLPLSDALHIACEVAGALDYVHARSVVHRDIKPENILLAAGHAVVTDFGIARAMAVADDESLSQTGVALGTPAYMSPEQVAGATNLDGRSDLYSLGCTLYEMLSGHPPFTGPNAHAILLAHLVERVPSIRRLRCDVPRAVESAIIKVLSKTAADRFATAADFAGALQPTSHPRATRGHAPRSVLPNQRVKLTGPAGTMEASVCAPATLRRGAQFPLRRRGRARSLRAIR